MKHKVKVTVIDKKIYPELQEKYCADPKAIMLDNNSTVKNQIKNKNHLLVEGFNDKTYLLQACLLS